MAMDQQKELKIQESLSHIDPSPYRTTRIGCNGALLPHGSLFGAPAVCSNGKAAMEWLEYVGTFWVQELLPSGNLTIFNSLLLKLTSGFSH